MTQRQRLHRTPTRIAALLLVPLLLAGCLDRKETWTIGPDGAVSANLTFTADARDELSGPDAIPGDESGWAVSTHTAQDPQSNKERFVLDATRSFAPGAALPSTYAPAGSPLARRALHWTMSVRREERADGLYIHVTRRFQPRPFNTVEYLRKTALHDFQNKLEESGPSEWTPADRRGVVEALLTYEMNRAICFAAEAFARLAPEAPQDIWLGVRQAALESRAVVDVEFVATMLGEPDNGQRDAALKTQVARFEEEFDRRLHDALKTVGGYDAAWIDRFDEEREDIRRSFGITESLAGHMFTITFEMPGEIVAHNADERDGNAVTWMFSGEAMRDREQVLMVTSRVPRE